MNKKKPRLYNKDIMPYYIHWASKFATMIIKHKQTADYIHWASKITTSAIKHADQKIIQNRHHFNRVQERLALLGSCSASS